MARDLGDAILLVARHRGRGRTSAAEVHGQTSYVYRGRDGRIVRAEIYPSRDDALETIAPYSNPSCRRIDTESE